MTEQELRKFINNMITEGVDNDEWWKEDTSSDTETANIPFDEEIKNELVELLENSTRLPGVNPKERAQQLMDIHKNWIEKTKQSMNAKKIAVKLYMYAITLNKK